MGGYTRWPGMHRPSRLTIDGLPAAAQPSFYSQPPHLSAAAGTAAAHFRGSPR
jgi:hypothetical protein